MTGLGLAECLIGAPATSRKALRLNEAEAIARCAQMFFAAEDQIRLRSRAERIHVAIGMPLRQHILPFCQRIEIVAIEKEPLGQFQIAMIPAAFVGEKEVLRECITLIPSPGDVLVRPLGHFGAREGFAGQIGQHSGGRAG